MSAWAVLPFLLTTWWTNVPVNREPVINQNLTAQSQSEELLRVLNHSSPFLYDRNVLDFYKPSLNKNGRSGMSVVDNTFKVVIDMQHFKPEEIKVMIRHSVNNYLVVLAKHEEKRDGDSISRRFDNEYLLPPCVNLDQLKSTISSNGVLTITAPLKSKKPKDERVKITKKPTLRPRTTEAPTTEAPTTEAPTTEAPTTEARTTEARTTEASTTVSTEKKVEGNDVREEVTTQAQLETAKPEK